MPLWGLLVLCEGVDFPNTERSGSVSFGHPAVPQQEAVKFLQPGTGVGSPHPHLCVPRAQIKSSSKKWPMQDRGQCEVVTETGANSSWHWEGPDSEKA